MQMDVTNVLKEKAGSFLQVDESAYVEFVSEKFRDFIEIRPIEEVDVEIGRLFKEKDEYVKKAIKKRKGGYYIRVKEGAKVPIPIQTCLVMKNSKEQIPWNFIEVEKNAEVTVYTGCTGAALLGEALHLGVTEMLLHENAKLNYVMLHIWPSGFEVRPRTAVLVSRNARFNSVYVVLRPGAIIQSMPVVYLHENASADLVSIISGGEKSLIDVGAEAHLLGKNASAIIRSRAVAKENSRIISRGRIVAEAEGRGHIECKGVMLSRNASIASIPEIDARNEEALLTHEASIGRLEEEQLFYLMSRGFTEDEARELLIKGFLMPNLPWLSEELKKEIERIVNLSAKGT